ncbi:uncharacterized protein LOC113772290 [Coffea eugenioides]|uniref:uncharacterized protein LOC113772290 n=1 Tax=Coffea eugenioides TaxID=49369 RepID=UPI000F605A51|nr:uncharacterized protein LOC113772290 [Coffea eugenioides]
MVVALGPGKFYGSSLPRPRFYTDVKLNDERVDPPVPVMDPLMSWAQEAHWSMGGLSFTRHRLQGRIEGNVKKLRAEREKLFKKAQKEKGSGSPVTPPAPVAVKRRRRMLVDEEEEEEEEVVVEEKRRELRKTARKLGDDFDRVANEKKRSPARAGGGGAAGRKRGRVGEEEEGGQDEIKGKLKGKKEIGKKKGEKNGAVAAKGTRTSPRLAKRG